MNVSTALELINGLDIGPFLTLTAEDHTHRYEAAVKVTTHFQGVETEREYFAEGRDYEGHEVVARASFVVQVADCTDAVDLYRKVFHDAVLETLVHEYRELFRVKATGWAPFHPHRLDGMKRWGAEALDRTYGVAS